jgi:hypothetical protein
MGFAIILITSLALLTLELLPEVTNIDCIDVLLNIILKGTFFTTRVVSLWISLPDEVVDYNTVNCFKGRLDKFWNNQSVECNWDACRLHWNWEPKFVSSTKLLK